MKINGNLIISLMGLLSVIGCGADTGTKQRAPDEATVSKKNPAEINSPNKRCGSLLEENKNLPLEVLVGTDVLLVQNFEAGNFAVGTYRSENGGAEITVVLRGSEGGIIAERQYLEPDVPLQAKTYTNICYEAEQLRGDFLQGKFVNGGLLWLELDPKNESIPSNLWIYLKKIN